MQLSSTHPRFQVLLIKVAKAAISDCSTGYEHLWERGKTKPPKDMAYFKFRGRGGNCDKDAIRFSEQLILFPTYSQLGSMYFLKKIFYPYSYLSKQLNIEITFR